MCDIFMNTKLYKAQCLNISSVDVIFKDCIFVHVMIHSVVQPESEIKHEKGFFLKVKVGAEAPAQQLPPTTPLIVFLII